MGRYDKISVYHNGAWKQPKRMYVYNNGWRDFGEANSNNTRTINVRYGNSWHRVTLNRKDTQKERGEFYAYGRFYVYPANGFCYYPDSDGSNWGFFMNVRKVESGDKILFYTYSTYGDVHPYLKIVWRDDGHIEVSNKYSASGTYYSIVSKNAYPLNEWISINVYAVKPTRAITLEILGKNDSQRAYMYGAFTISTATTYIGDSGLHYRAGFTVYGDAYSGSSGKVEFNFNDRPGKYTAGSNYSMISYNEKETYTETTWV